MANTLVIHPGDSVGVALHDLHAGAEVEPTCDHVQGVATRQAIPFGHKVALVPIRDGERIIKYGASIGVAAGDIAPGEHVHVHSLRSVRGAAQ